MAEFEKIVKSAEKLNIIIDFSAEWCGPCKMIAPKFEECANNFNLVFIKV